MITKEQILKDHERVLYSLEMLECVLHVVNAYLRGELEPKLAMNVIVDIVKEEKK